MTVIDSDGNIEYTDLPPAGGPPAGGPQQDRANTDLRGVIQGMDETLNRLQVNSIFGAYDQGVNAQAEWTSLTTRASLTINNENGESIDILEELKMLKEENKKLRRRLEQIESTVEELKNWREV
jgi:hypothetical protein